DAGHGEAFDPEGHPPFPSRVERDPRDRRHRSRSPVARGSPCAASAWAPTMRNSAPAAHSADNISTKSRFNPVPLHEGPGLRRERAAAVARHAGGLGFESVWVPEHLALPTRITSRYPYAPDGIPPFSPDTPHLDPLVLLTHVAAATVRIRLGTSVYLLPLRHPLVTARLALSLDVLSGGRLTLGVGVGWLAEEFQ